MIGRARLARRGRRKNNVERNLAQLVRQGQAVAGGRDFAHTGGVLRLLHLYRRAARVHQIAHDAAFDERQRAPADAFTIEWHARLQRVIRIVPNRDVLTE